MEWFTIAGPALALAGVIFTVVWNARGDKRRARSEEKNAQQADLAARFDDASQLAQYIREEVERQVAPIREQLEKVKTESHDMHDAVRSHFTQLWLWDQKGRLGPLPMLPIHILHRLGLGHLLDEPPEDTEPINP